jgi:hypothetical protein
MILAFAVLFIVIVIPSLPGAENSRLIMNALEPVLCKSGETLTQETRVQTDMRGTMRSPEFYCEAEPGARREVTNKATTYAMVGFVCPFVVGLLLTLAGFAGIARRAASAALQLPQAAGLSNQTGPDGATTLNVGGIPIRITTKGQMTVPDTPSSETSAAEKLRQLQDLRANNLISQEEYDRLRGQILDESF